MTQSTQNVSDLALTKSGRIDRRKIPRPWKWTRRKRHALQLVMRGMTNKAIGREVGVDERTIRRWRKHKKFQEELVAKTQSYVQERSYKRAYETGLLADQMARLAARRIQQVGDRLERGEEHELGLGGLQTFLREYRAMKDSERTDLGLDQQQGGGSGISVNVGIGIGNQSPDQMTPTGKGVFKDFVEHHLKSTPKREVTEASTPQEALIKAAESIVTDTDVLEELYGEED